MISFEIKAGDEHAACLARIEALESALLRVVQEDNACSDPALRSKSTISDDLSHQI
jgi:hypothetical protein